MNDFDSRIHVAFVLPAVGSHKLGGMEKVAASLLSNLDHNKFSGSLVCFNSINGAIDLVDQSTIAVHVVEKRHGVDPMMLTRLYNLFKQIQPDVVHTFNDGALIYAFPAARLVGVPALVHAEHGRLQIAEGSVLKKIRIAMTRRADRVVVVSKTLKQLMIDEGVADLRVSTIINGVDLTPFDAVQERPIIRRSLGIGKHEFVVGAVGSLTLAKNHALLVRAAAEVPDIRVLVAGAGPLESSLKELIQQMGLSERVSCIGRVDDVPAFLSAIDLFALPSTTEGTSLALLEAMAARLAVVATNVGGNGGVVIDGTTGFLTPSGDVSALAGRINWCRENREETEEMGRKGRSWVEAEYDFAQTVHAYEKVFEQVLGAQRPMLKQP